MIHARFIFVWRNRKLNHRQAFKREDRCKVLGDLPGLYTCLLLYAQFTERKLLYDSPFIFLNCGSLQRKFSAKVQFDQKVMDIIAKLCDIYKKIKGFSRKIEEYCMFFSGIGCYNHHVTKSYQYI